MITPQARKNADGSYSYTVRFRNGINKAGTGPRMTSETFTNKRKAEQFAKWIDAVGVEGALDLLYAGVDIELPTLSQVAEDHFAHLISVEPGTLDKYRSLWKRIWGPRLGHLLVNEVGPDQIGLAFKDLARSYSKKSMENQRGLLSGVMGRAVAKGYIPRNPVQDVRRLPTGQPSRGKDDLRILTVDEFAAVEAACPEHYRPLLRFLWGTGCRYGEAIAVQGQDLRGSNVTIRRALKYSQKRADAKFGPPKNGKKRTVALPPELVDELHALKAQHGAHGLLFQYPSGGMVWHTEFHQGPWTTAIKGIDPKPRIHDLRHSHASHLLARGVPIHIVSERLGHASIEITIRVYGHLMPDAQKVASDAAALAFRSTPKAIDP